MEVSNYLKALKNTQRYACPWAVGNKHTNTLCNPFNQKAVISFLETSISPVNSHKQFSLAEILHLVECWYLAWCSVKKGLVIKETWDHCPSPICVSIWDIIRKIMLRKDIVPHIPISLLCGPMRRMTHKIRGCGLANQLVCFIFWLLWLL